jgi:hypothetical protein
MTRYKASAIHLGLCVLVGALVLAIMLFVWFPGPYFQAMHAGGLLLILLGVDLTIGPLITLVIYKHGKKGLKFDLVAIAFMQLGALFYGMHIVYQARPVYLVFTVDSFDVVAANDLSSEELRRAVNTEFGRLPLMGPRLVAVRKPQDPKEREKILMSSLEGGPDLPQMPRYYVPYVEEKTHVAARIKGLDALLKKRPGLGREIQSLLAKTGLTMDRVGYIPVRSRKEQMTALVNKDTSEVLKLVAIDPWG